MRIISKFVLSIIFATSFLCAHRQPEALTTIEFNPNTQTTEIVHHLHAHDASRILEGTEHQALQLDSIEGQARIALYVEARFEIIALENKLPIKLKLIGAELEDGTLYVFQEYAARITPPIKIHNRILHDQYPDQANTVNMLHEGRVITQVFSKNDGLKQFQVHKEAEGK